MNSKINISTSHETVFCILRTNRSLCYTRIPTSRMWRLVIFLRKCSLWWLNVSNIQHMCHHMELQRMATDVLFSRRLACLIWITHVIYNSEGQTVLLKYNLNHHAAGPNKVTGQLQSSFSDLPLTGVNFGPWTHLYCLQNPGRWRHLSRQDVAQTLVSDVPSCFPTSEGSVFQVSDTSGFPGPWVRQESCWVLGYLGWVFQALQPLFLIQEF